MDVKGLKIKDIMGMDWETLNKMSTKDLKAVTSRLVSASNKRIRSLEKAPRGRYSYAYKTIEDRGRNFSVRNKNVGQVKQEFKLAKKFLEMKTSTRKGWEEVRTDMEKRVSKYTYGESQTWSERTWERYWEVYRKTEEIHGGSYTKGDSARVQQKLYKIFVENDKRHGVDYFSDIVESQYEKLYEEVQEERIQDQFVQEEKEEKGIEIPTDEDEDLM